MRLVGKRRALKALPSFNLSIFCSQNHLPRNNSFLWRFCMYVCMSGCVGVCLFFAFSGLERRTEKKGSEQ